MPAATLAPATPLPWVQVAVSGPSRPDNYFDQALWRLKDQTLLWQPLHSAGSYGRHEGNKYQSVCFRCICAGHLQCRMRRHLRCLLGTAETI